MNNAKAVSDDTLWALETAPSMFLVLSTDLYVLTASNLLLEELGVDLESIKGRYIFDAFPPNQAFAVGETKKSVIASIASAMQTRRTHYLEVQRYDIIQESSNGNFLERYWRISHTPVYDRLGELSYIVQTADNVTEEIIQKLYSDKIIQAHNSNLKQVDLLNRDLEKAHKDLLRLNSSLESDVAQRTAQLASSEMKYRNLIDYSPVAMQVFRGEELRFELVNAAMLQFLGKTDDIIGKTLFEGVPEIVGQPIVEALLGVYRTGKPLEIFSEKVILERDGIRTEGYYDVIYRALYEGSEITGVLGIAIDVTPQVLAQQSIIESEERFRTMAEGSDILISLIGTDGLLEYVNAAWLRLTGWSRENLQELAWEKFMHPDDISQVAATVAKGMQSREAFLSELRMLDTVGSFRWLRIKGTPRLGSNGIFAGFVCSGIDVTEEKQRLLEIEYINKALRSSNEKLQDSNLKLTENEEKLLIAFDAGELGSCSLDLRTGRADMSERYRRHYGLPLDGDITWEMVLQAVEAEFLDEVNVVLENAIKFGSPVDSTYAIRHLQTGERRWMRVVGKVYQGATGTNDWVYAVVMDVTAIKNDEQRKNDFIAMVSHELKTPLTSINGYTQLLQAKAKKGEPFDGLVFLDRIQVQLRKMTSMVNGFLNVSRLESAKIKLDKSKFDLSRLALEMEQEFASLVSSHSIEFAPGQEIWIEADRDKISHVISNFLSNAVKYSPRGSKITMDCVLNGNGATLRVSDEGIGVENSDIVKVFDRYYRVESESTSKISGFGIGLYLCAEIIERHNGKIGVESEIGSGSTFYFSLPVAD